MKLQVCRGVMLGDRIYGAYIDGEQAPLDPVDAAHDAMQSGRDRPNWGSENARPAARIL